MLTTRGATQWGAHPHYYKAAPLLHLEEAHMQPWRPSTAKSKWGNEDKGTISMHIIVKLENKQKKLGGDQRYSLPKDNCKTQ